VERIYFRLPLAQIISALGHVRVLARPDGLKLIVELDAVVERAEYPGSDPEFGAGKNPPTATGRNSKSSRPPMRSRRVVAPISGRKR